MFRRSSPLLLLALLATGSCDIRQRTPPTGYARCATALDPCLTTCLAGDAESCRLSRVLVHGTLDSLAATEPEKRAHWMAVGCKVGDAELCLKSAIHDLGEPPAHVLGAAARACSLDPNIDVTAAEGRHVTCKSFDPATVDRAAKLGRACRARDASACRRFGELLAKFDLARAKTIARRGCELAGIAGNDLERCASFALKGGSSG
jgi:hypothetical protein